MTLGEYKKLALTLFGRDSKSVQFFQKKIDEQGEDEEVIAEDSQMMSLMGQLEYGGKEK